MPGHRTARRAPAPPTPGPSRHSAARRPEARTGLAASRVPDQAVSPRPTHQPQSAASQGGTMSLVHDLYPHHRPPAGNPVPGRHDPASLVVCLPPAAGRHIVDLVGELVERLRPHVAAPAGL